jgi:serine carboxypeptidase-like clade 1
VPTLGTEEWIRNLGWEITEKYRPYMVDEQVGGYFEARDGLDFGTVHGVGHMAPQWSPKATSHLISSWMKGEKV